MPNSTQSTATTVARWRAAAEGAVECSRFCGLEIMLRVRELIYTLAHTQMASSILRSNDAF